MQIRRNAAALFMVLITVTPATFAQNVKSSGAEQELRALLVDYGNAIAAADAGMASAMYLASPAFLVFTDGARYTYEQMLEHNRRVLPMITNYTMTWDTIDVRPLTANVAALFSTFHQSYVMQGRKSQIEGAVSWIAVLDNGKWKLVYGHAEHRPVAAAYVAEVRAAIERNNRNLERWYAAGDVDSVMTVFAEDARQMPPADVMLEGRAAIRSAWRGMMTLGRWDFSIKTHDVAVSGDVAVERGRYQLAFTPRDPSQMKSSLTSGNYLVQWRRVDGEWLIVNDIASSDGPPK